MQSKAATPISMLPTPNSLKNRGSSDGKGSAGAISQTTLPFSHSRTSFSASACDNEQRSFTMVVSCRSFLMVEASKKVRKGQRAWASTT